MTLVNSVDQTPEPSSTKISDGLIVDSGETQGRS